MTVFFLEYLLFWRLLFDTCRSSHAPWLNEPSICVFGRHESKKKRSSVVLFNSNREETVVAETEYRAFCSVAYLNGEIFVCINPTTRVTSLDQAKFNVFLVKDWSWLRYSSLQIWHDQGTYSLATLHRCLFLSIVNDATPTLANCLLNRLLYST